MTRKAAGVCRALQVGAIAVGLVTVGMPAVRAQQVPSSATQIASGPEGAPPVVRFAAGGITLEEAVRLALEHGPFIQRSEADAAFSAGVAQQRSGLFDLTLLGNASFTHRVQELTESRKAEEQKKRDDLQAQVDAGPSAIANAQEARDLVVGVRDGTVSLEQLAEVSPTLSGLLGALDALISTTPPGADRDALVEARNSLLDQAVNTAEDELAFAQDFFDGTRQGLADLGPAPEDEYFRDFTTDVQLSKTLRSGITIAPFFNSEYSSTNFVGKPRDAQFGGKGLDDLYTFRAGFGVMLPLARGRGATSVAAGERAALIERDASLRAIEHERATTTLETVIAYWQLRAAQETVDVVAQSLQFQDQLVGVIQQLVSGGDLAGVELSRAQAAQARARADVDAATQRLTEARVGLAVAMGVAATDDDATLPFAGEAFPQLEQAPVATDALASEALGQRQDLGAATQFEEAGRVLVEGARSDTKSRIDLSVSSWYTALDEGTVRRAVDRWVGPSGSVELQYEKPLGNNLRLGQLAQREADASRRQIDQRDLARQIQLSVLQSGSTLQESMTRVQQAQAAVDFYQTTIDAEFARLQAGDSDLIDTITTQQQQTGALLSLVTAQLELARRIAELRFQTGTLISSAGLRAQDLVTLPGAGGR